MMFLTVFFFRCWSLRQIPVAHGTTTRSQRRPLLQPKTLVAHSSLHKAFLQKENSSSHSCKPYVLSQSSASLNFGQGARESNFRGRSSKVNPPPAVSVNLCEVSLPILKFIKQRDEAGEILFMVGKKMQKVYEDSKVGHPIQNIFINPLCFLSHNMARFC